MEETTMEIAMNKLPKLVKHLNGVIGVPVARNVEQDTKGEQDCTSCLLYQTDHVMSDCMTRMIAMDQTHLVTPMDSSKILTQIRFQLTIMRDQLMGLSRLWLDRIPSTTFQNMRKMTFLILKISALLKRILDLAMDILKDGILTLIQELVKHSATLAALEIETILLESRNVKLLVYNQTLLITIIKKTTGPNIGPIITSITNMTPHTLQQVRILTISFQH